MTTTDEAAGGGATMLTAPGYLARGGEMGERMRAHDWAATPLGPLETWPQALQSAVSIMLNSRFPIALYWGPDLALVYNDAWSPIPGEKHPGALGQPGRVVWPEIWDTIGPLYERVILTGEGVWQEDELLPMHRHGYLEECYYNFTFSPVTGADGKVEGIFNAVIETTNQVLAARRLRTLARMGAKADATLSIDQACRWVAGILSENPHDVPFALIYVRDGEGWRLAASTGLQAGDPAAPATLPLGANAPWPMAEAASQAIAAPPPPIARTASPWPEPVVEALTLPVILAGDTEPAAYLVAGVNPRRRLDDDYRAFFDLAAGHVATALAAARAFEEERRRAEALAEIDRAKTAFFANVSHEFRTPLTLMLGPLEDAIAEASSAPAGQRELLDTAHRNALRLLRLVNGLLDFSRIEAGRAQANFQPTNLAAYTAELASAFRSVTEKAGLALKVETPALSQPVYVDRAMWEKVVLNLVSNAFKFTFEGTITVALAEADGAARLTVSDSGVGIPTQELPRLFERFHRVEGAQGRSFEGSGIGLALVQELVRQHGGTITVESQEGRGSTFTVTVPLGRSHLPADIGGDVAELGPGGRARSYVEEALRWLPPDDTLPGGDLPTDAEPGGHVLLADDNADLRHYIARLLGDQGFTVEAVADGEAALAAAKARRPDLVVTDVMMPKLDGFGLLTAIRGEEALRDLPVLMLSARAGEEAKVGGLVAGADDYLTKPFSARELVARVSANIAAARQRHDLLQSLRVLNQAAAAALGDLDLEGVVQIVTDAGVELTGAEFGAFFYNVTDEAGERYTLYTLSGVDRSHFERFPMPRNTAVFAPTFSGEGAVRSDDITKDPRYGHSAPYNGMPKGHLPVCSYLAVPVRSRSGEVLGGLFYGHSQPGQFSALSEDRLVALATQAAVAMDNAQLFQANRRELAERRRAERALQALNATLEERVAEEVAERARAEDALRQAQKMEAVGQLTGGIAHDFNNLLTVIMGGLDTIRRSRPEDEVRAKRALDMAYQSAERAAGLTSRLLAFSRRQPLKPLVLDANGLVRDMTDMLHRTLGEQVELEGVLAPRLWPIEVDQNQFESAVLNLAVNARDAMPDGGKLTIETSNTMLDDAYAATDAEVIPGQYVAIAVSDTGSGMSQADLARVFEPFFTTKEVGKGTGLGLSMVYGFVKQSGGHVTIYSEEGQGTTVKLYFPRFRGEGEAAEAATGHEAPPSSDGEVILVVEDNEDVRAYSVMVLTELGYAVIEAENADQGLEILQTDQRVDLLFTDVVLPGKSGKVLADAAAQLRPGLKVLFTTGYSRNAIVHQGRLDADVQLVTKPFTYEQLATKVRDVLDKRDR